MRALSLLTMPKLLTMKTPKQLTKKMPTLPTAIRTARTRIPASQTPDPSQTAVLQTPAQRAAHQVQTQTATPRAVMLPRAAAAHRAATAHRAEAAAVTAAATVAVTAVAIAAATAAATTAHPQP